MKKIFSIYLLFSMMLMACDEKDIVLMNEVKTLDAKWIRVAEQISELKHLAPEIQKGVSEGYMQLQSLAEQDSLYADSLLRLQQSFVEDISNVGKYLPGHIEGFEYEKENFDKWYASANLNKSKTDETRSQIEEFIPVVQYRANISDSLLQVCKNIIVKHNTLRENIIRQVEWIQYDAISFR